MRPELAVAVPVVYRNIEHFRKKILALKLRGWCKTENNDDNNVLFELFNPTHILPKLSLRVGSGLNFTVGAFNWLLPDNHFIYTNTCDGASPNRLFFQLHADVASTEIDAGEYWTFNVFTPDRKIYFFSFKKNKLFFLKRKIYFFSPTFCKNSQELFVQLW